MTREELIKSLDACIKNARENSCRHCADCPAADIGGDCEDILQIESADHIRQLLDEVDTLKSLNRKLESQLDEAREQLKRKVADVFPEFLKEYRATCEELDNAYKEIAELTMTLEDLRQKYKKSLIQDRRVARKTLKKEGSTS